MNTLRIRDIAVPQRPDEDCWEVKMRKAMQQALSAEDFADLARSLMGKAKAGDKTALQVVLGQVLQSAPKTLVVHQHFQPRKKKKRGQPGRPKKIKGNGQQACLPRHEPPTEDIERQVNELRGQKGLPPATWSRD